MTTTEKGIEQLLEHMPLVLHAKGQNLSSQASFAEYVENPRPMPTLSLWRYHARQADGSASSCNGPEAREALQERRCELSFVLQFLVLRFSNRPGDGEHLDVI
jgi:hypothetical protein